MLSSFFANTFISFLIYFFNILGPITGLSFEVLNLLLLNADIEAKFESAGNNQEFELAAF